MPGLSKSDEVIHVVPGSKYPKFGGAINVQSLLSQHYLLLIVLLCSYLFGIC